MPGPAVLRVEDFVIVWALPGCYTSTAGVVKNFLPMVEERALRWPYKATDYSGGADGHPLPVVAFVGVLAFFYCSCGWTD